MFQPWVVHEANEVYDAAPWLRLTAQRVTLPNGHEIPRQIVSWQRASAVVVPLNERGEVILVKQYKHGIGRATLEFPAGYLERPDEDPLLCAMRELREETGRTSTEWQYLGHYYREPNRGQTLIHYYLARACVPGPAHLDETEDLMAHSFPLSEIEEMFFDGRMPSLHCLGAWAVARPWIPELQCES